MAFNITWDNEKKTDRYKKRQNRSLERQNVAVFDYIHEVIFGDKADHRLTNAFVNDYLGEMLEQADETPDMVHLNNHLNHYLFVYDNMKKAFPFNNQLKDAVFVGSGNTTDIFNMFVYDNEAIGAEAVVCNNGPTENRAVVYGEVYLVRPKLIRAIDLFMTNGCLYNRYRTRVKLSSDPKIDGIPKHLPFFCWWYKGNDNAWSKTLEDNKLKVVKPNPNSNVAFGKQLIYLKGDSIYA